MRTGRHGEVRTFGRRAPSGVRPSAFVTGHVPARAFGDRSHFIVRAAVDQSLLCDDDKSSVANLAAAMGVAAILISGAPANAGAFGGSTAASDITEVIEPAYDGMDVPTAEAISGDETADWRDLYLEVVINNVSTGLAGHFRETTDGGLSCEVAELAEVGLKPAESAIGPDGWVRVDQLPGVEYRIDEEAQKIFVTTGMDGRSTRKIDLKPGAKEDRMTPTAG